MRKFRILIVCPDPQGLALLTSMLKSLGHLIEEASTDRGAVRLMERSPMDLVLASVDPGESEALELLSYTRRKYSEVPVILMFPRAHPDRAKEALRLGAMAVLKYPVPAAELRAAVLQALEQCQPRAADGRAATPHAGLSSRPQAYAATAAAPASSQGVAPANLFAMPMSFASPARLPSYGTPGLQSMDPVDGVLRPVDTPAAFPTSPARPAPREAELVTTDPGLRQVIELAATLAGTSAPVLIVGEPGTGKSLLAQILHDGGGPPDRPFVVLRAGDLEEPEADGEGEEPEPAARRGAAASALTEWARKLDSARGGTLFIEEVGALPAEIQLQLQREFQYRDIEVAAGRARHNSQPGVRFILSTSENLPAAVEQGRFRPELYHRISALSLMVPPLRLRGTDVELLAEQFRARFAHEFHKDVVGFTRDALEALQKHEWPGNVRELQGVIQRAVSRCSSPRITSSHLTPILNLQRQARAAAGTSGPHVPMGIRPLKEALEEPEKRIIIQALQAFNWNRQETARVLDINRTTLYKKMKKYGLLVDEPIWAG
ncbi:Transcriptional regulatory protein ZraR [Aquisphaera giovannonii]|uniref:Transcriptional regulatory protein ZraR n=1 Tax=Aquisphaera giovannonii TaxID=406548 RepID=A0A5B9W212_9BACT|nr:sigma 54-interacting transcriptional regulator [Aquisphaera giovannonii]QEH34702.1 Transcriptional regulatory protein ZraR [Aquisphaera giovannonii]